MKLYDIILIPLYEQSLTDYSSEQGISSESFNHVNQTQARVPLKRVCQLAKQRLKSSYKKLSEK